MLKKVSGWFWIRLVAAVAIYAVLGVWFRMNNRVELGLFQWTFGLAALVPFLFVTIYTVLWRWHENDWGINLALTNVGLIPFFGIFDWVFIIDKGNLHDSWLAWALPGSALWFIAFLSWRGILVLRSRGVNVRTGSNKIEPTNKE